MTYPLYILTVVTHPRLLAFISAGIADIISAGQPVAWLMAPGRQNDPGGQRTKNKLIAQVPADAWFWICDDDTVPHPKLLPTLHTVWEDHSDAEMIVVSQRRSGIPSDDASPVLIASREAMKPGHVDMGQLIIRKRAMEGMAIPHAYDGDGQLAEHLANVLGDRVVYVDIIASLHNWTRVLCNRT